MVQRQRGCGRELITVLSSERNVLNLRDREPVQVTGEAIVHRCKPEFIASDYATPDLVFCETKISRYLGPQDVQGYGLGARLAALRMDTEEAATHRSEEAHGQWIDSKSPI